MPGLDDENDAVLVQRRADDVGVSQLAHEPDLDLLAQDELEHLLGVPGADADADARVADREALEDPRQDVRRSRRRRAQGEAARPAPLERVDEATAVREAVERLDRVREEGIAGLGEFHAARGADEELRAKILLEALQAGGERRLRHEERVGGAADRPRPRDLDERLDLRDQHRSSLYRGSKKTIW